MEAWDTPSIALAWDTPRTTTERQGWTAFLATASVDIHTIPTTASISVGTASLVGPVTGAGQIVHEERFRETILMISQAPRRTLVVLRARNLRNRSFTTVRNQ